MPCPTRFNRAATAATTVAALLMITADLLNDESFYRLGLVGLCCAAVWLIALRTGLTAEMLDRAWQNGRREGHREGYEEGREIGRPVIVQIPVSADPVRRAAPDFGNKVI